MIVAGSLTFRPLPPIAGASARAGGGNVGPVAPPATGARPSVSSADAARRTAARRRGGMAAPGSWDGFVGGGGAGRRPALYADVRTDCYTGHGARQKGGRVVRRTAVVTGASSGI